MAPVRIIQLGLGGVGSAFLSQLADLRQTQDLPLVLASVSDSSATISSAEGMSPPEMRALVALKGSGGTLQSVPGAAPLSEAKHLLAEAPERTIVVDLTASDATLPLLKAAVESGAGVVLANKRPLSGSQSAWDTLTATGLTRYEATVGAGLPVIHALRYLQETGDSVRVIEGMLSGTLGYLLSGMDDEHTYSEVLREAHRLGYTEPDARDDLGGMDVARKAVILARTVGRRLELGDIPVQALFPDSMRVLSAEDFLKQSPCLDDEYRERQAEAQSRGQVLRYLARISESGVSVGPQEVPAHSPFGNLEGADNLVTILTQRYISPLRIAGPGAGAAVTAAGVMGDVIELARCLSHR